MSSGKKDNCGDVTCTKVDDQNCVLSRVCKLETPDGVKDCDWSCKCSCKSGDCMPCACDCECTLKNAVRVGDRYKCECSCNC